LKQNRENAQQRGGCVSPRDSFIHAMIESFNDSQTESPVQLATGSSSFTSHQGPLFFFYFTKRLLQQSLRLPDLPTQRSLCTGDLGFLD
jgi:hypothetical protein